MVISQLSIDLLVKHVKWLFTGDLRDRRNRLSIAVDDRIFVNLPLAVNFFKGEIVCKRSIETLALGESRTCTSC